MLFSDDYVLNMLNIHVVKELFDYFVRIYSLLRVKKRSEAELRVEFRITK